MPLPGIQVIDQQSVMIAPIVRYDSLLALADDVQLLIVAKPKPGPWKTECRTGNRRELQYIAIERHRPLDVSDMDGYVVELGDMQWKAGVSGESCKQGYIKLAR